MTDAHTLTKSALGKKQEMGVGGKALASVRWPRIHEPNAGQKIDRTTALELPCHCRQAHGRTRETAGSHRPPGSGERE